MVAKIANDVQPQQTNACITREDGRVGCSVGIMAYNEEANIERTLRAILTQEGPSMYIEEVLVVASGCTDRTVPIVTAIAEQEPRVRLYIQEKREGKASAINLFLKKAASEVAILIGADVIPHEAAIEHLCAPFKNPHIGMVGGRPVPVNDSATFMGHTVHLLWRLHDKIARIHPKLGEVIAFRNVISGIPANSAVDEISIQALISQLGYELIYQPTCVVYNKGPITVRDFLKQRRRIYAGHLTVRTRQNYEACTMKVAPIVRQLFSCQDFAMSSPTQTCWTIGAIALEGYARIQGYYDYLRKREHHIWQMVDSTKDLEAGQRKVRRICNAQSVIVFRLILEGADGDDSDREREDRQATDAARKLIPFLRTRVRREDRLSVNGPGIITAVIRAEQSGAEIVARRIKQLVEESIVHLRGREVKLGIAYSTLTFASKVPQGPMLVSKELIGQTLIAALSSEGN